MLERSSQSASLQLYNNVEMVCEPLEIELRRSRRRRVSVLKLFSNGVQEENARNVCPLSP